VLQKLRLQLQKQRHFSIVTIAITAWYITGLFIIAGRIIVITAGHIAITNKTNSPAITTGLFTYGACIYST